MKNLSWTFTDWKVQGRISEPEIHAWEAQSHSAAGIFMFEHEYGWPLVQPPAPWGQGIIYSGPINISTEKHMVFLGRLLQCLINLTNASIIR